jgi:hypothetical protein
LPPTCSAPPPTISSARFPVCGSWITGDGRDIPTPDADGDAIRCPLDPRLRLYYRNSCELHAGGLVT